MQQDKNARQEKACPGTLRMLATHIGRACDIPARALSALQTSDLLIFEEDRPARVALKTAKVQREYLKFSEHQQKETLDELRRCLRAGKTAAYMSDQGSPTLADPGGGVLSVAYELGARIEVVPGPSSLTAALMACPFVMPRFYFAGFLPREDAKRRRTLQELGKRREGLVVMDTPYRLAALLAGCAEVMPERRGFLALDISGPDEAYLSGRFTRLAEATAELGKLNFVLVVAPP